MFFHIVTYILRSLGAMAHGSLHTPTKFILAVAVIAVSQISGAIHHAFFHVHTNYIYEFTKRPNETLTNCDKLDISKTLNIVRGGRREESLPLHAALGVHDRTTNGICRPCANHNLQWGMLSMKDVNCLWI